MSIPASPLAGDALQFDRAEHVHSDHAHPSDSHSVRCSSCNRTLDAEYYDVGGAPACRPCKEQLVRAAAPVREAGPTFRAMLLGFGAAIVGAFIYYGVIAITDFEIGLVAILTGYIVGWSVRRGAGNRGGRRLQVGAMALTYLSVALAYTPLAMKGISEEAEAQAHADSIAAAAPAIAAATPASPGDAVAAQQGGAPDAAGDGAFEAEDQSVTGGIGALAIVIGFVLALPLFMVFGSMPSGLISALIIGFGMHQAWRMTGTTPLHVAGPLRVGTTTGSDAAE